MVHSLSFFQYHHPSLFHSKLVHFPADHRTAVTNSAVSGFHMLICFCFVYISFVRRVVNYTAFAINLCHTNDLLRITWDVKPCLLARSISISSLSTAHSLPDCPHDHMVSLTLCLPATNSVNSADN